MIKSMMAQMDANRTEMQKGGNLLGAVYTELIHGPHAAYVRPPCCSTHGPMG